MSDENIVNEGQPSLEEFETISQFLEDLPEDEWADFDPSQLVTINSSAGGNFTIRVEEPATIRDLLGRAGLTAGLDTEWWVGGISVEPDFVVAPGTSVTAIGMVKGG